MPWIYAFAERGENRYVKIGLAQDHYHERFEKSQQCNPIPIEIAATWQFPSAIAAKQCEREIKRGTVFQKWVGGGPEWFCASSEQVRANPAFGKLVADLGGRYCPPVRFSGNFRETLNLGARDRSGSTFRPHLYLVAEHPSTGACKVALSCYNWPTVAAHYVTYNPRKLQIAGRWSFRDHNSGAAFLEKLTRQCASQMINPLGWFQMDPEELNALVSQSGATHYPRTSPLDDQVDYTRFRVPVS